MRRPTRSGLLATPELRKMSAFSSAASSTICDASSVGIALRTGICQSAIIERRARAALSHLADDAGQPGDALRDGLLVNRRVPEDQAAGTRVRDAV